MINTIDTKLVDEKKVVCAGCDNKDYTTTWSINNKEYCNRCLIEVKALYEKQVEKWKNQK